MKKTRLITVLTVAAMLYATCGTAFSVELNLKNLKDAAKKELDQKRGAKKDGSEKENSEKQNASTDSNSNTANTEPNSEDDFDWKVNDDFTEITITKYKGKRKDVVIPSTIQDVPVTRIGNSAFNPTGDWGMTHIESVIIPEGIKEIGEKAFYSQSFKSIQIPKGCTLKSGAFIKCYELESVTLPEGLKIIPRECFSGCEKLTNINFPSTLKYIGSFAFGGYKGIPCCSLTSVELPEGLEYIGSDAFTSYDFTSNTITSISLPKSLKWVVYGLAIIKDDNITTITIAEGCAPKIIYGAEGMDGRNIIKGASIAKSLKLQKQLAALKLTLYERKKDGDALKKDLMSYGFTEEEAQDKL